MRPRRDQGAAPLTFAPTWRTSMAHFRYLPFPFSVFPSRNVEASIPYIGHISAITSLTALETNFMCFACPGRSISMYFADITHRLVAAAKYRWVLHPAGCLFYCRSVGNKSIKRIILSSLPECFESRLQKIKAGISDFFMSIFRKCRKYLKHPTL